MNSIKDVTDPRLIDFYNTLQLQDVSNTNREITRSEFMKLIINAAGLENSQGTGELLASFSDINIDDPSAKYFSIALENGIIHGQNIAVRSKNGEIIQKKILRPNEKISRQEAAKILVEMIRDKELPKKSSTFSDVSVNNPLAPYIEYAFDLCLLHGKNTRNGKVIEGTKRYFAPTDNITLAEAAKILLNMLKKK